MSIEKTSVVAAETRHKDASKRLGDVSEDVREPDEQKFQFVLSSSTELQKCQRAIELSAKSLLDLSGVDYPKSHDFDLYSDYVENCIGALEGKLSKEDGGKAYRVFVLASIWSGAYPATEYGIAEKSPDVAFNLEDAEIAYTHAEEAHDKAEEVIEKAKSEVGESEDES